MKNILTLIKKTFAKWSEDKASRLAAALAYYAVFSLGPILVIALAVVGLFWSEASAQEQVVQQITDLTGEQAAGLVESMLAAARGIGSSWMTAIVGVVALVFGAIGVFGQLSDALNTIWNVRLKPDGGVLRMLRQRSLAFALVIGIGLMLLISLVVSSALSILQNWMTGLFPGLDVITQVANLLISLFIITLMFALLFKFVPNVRIAWRDVWLGAAVTALLFTTGQFLIGLYLGSGSAVEGFGAAGSLVILLLWVYYSAQILFLGAEFTQVYANQRGSRIVPDDEAVLMESGGQAGDHKSLAAGVEAAFLSETAPDLGRSAEDLRQASRFPVSRERPLLPVFSLVSLAAGMLAGFLLGLAIRVRN